MTKDQCALKHERQSDEWVCQTCGLRWSFDEDRPPCNAIKSIDPHEIVAKAILGPRHSRHIGREKMLELREFLWSRNAYREQKADAMQAATAVLAELTLLDPQELAKFLEESKKT